VKGGADIQYLTAMLFQLRERRATDIESSFEIDVNNSPKTIWGQLFSRDQEISGGAVNDDVDLSKVSNGRGNGLFHLFGIAHVRGDRKRFAATLVYCGRCGFKVLQLAANQRNAGAGFRQRSRHASGDAGAAAGYECDVVV
jgi:hypothetical protein